MQRERTIDAVIISVLAARACKNIQIDGNNAKLAINYHGYKTLDDLPEDKLRYFMERFSSNRDAACNFALARYGADPNAQTNQGLRFLRYAPSNPFAN